MKQKMFTLFAVAILFAATTADSFAQLTKIWEIPSPPTVQALNSNAKLAHVGGYLVDLTNGNIIHTVQSPDYLFMDYSGKRYFVSNGNTQTFKVYDRYTKEFIQDLTFRQYVGQTINAPNDSIKVEFERNTHTLKFWNIYTNELIDNYKIPNTPDIWTYSIYDGAKFSYNGRYFAFHFQKKTNAEFNYFMIYDRQTREIIMKKALPANTGYGLIYQFMHTSNNMAYGEVIKLDGDDKPYSYIRIYDPDQRKVIRDIKVGDEVKGVANLTIRNDDNFILYMLRNTNNTLCFYNFEINKLSDFIISPMSSILMADGTLLVTKSMTGYNFDWTVVGVPENPETSNTSTIYPNPTTNSINLLVEEKYFNGQWQLKDLSGRDILNGIILSNPQLQIDISNLPSATYYLRLTNGKEIKVEKVVKW